MNSNAATENERTYSVATVTRAVVLSQALFTAGNSLTTGGFFNYFVNDLHPGAFLFALVQIAPENSEAMSFFSRWLIVRFYNRKLVWIYGLLLARVVALLIPLAILYPHKSWTGVPMIYILTCTVVWYVCQGAAYLSLISWLSDLVPEQNWGKFFAQRRMAHLAILIIVPISAGMLRKHYLNGFSSSAEHWIYAIIFIVGGLLAIASIIPMLRLPHVSWRQQATARNVSLFKILAENHNLHFLLASRWWLAFFQGFSQIVLLQFSMNVLKVPLETYYIFSALMYLTQILFSWQAGRLSDRSQDRNGLAFGMVLVSLGMLFLFFATTDNHWILAGTYLMWGAFGMVNLCGENLCLKLTPPGDNSAQFSLYHQTSGLIAGGAGLLGGWWLDRLLTSVNPEAPQMPFYVLISIGFLGRITAPLWLIGVKQPQGDR